MENIGDWNKIGNGNIIGDGNKLGNYNKLGDCNTLGDENTLGDGNKLGNYNKLGSGNIIGDWNKIGNGNIIGSRNKIGECLKVGTRFSAECVRVIDFFTMANVDGTGRQIQVFIHTEGVLVRAGCFKGTLDEFCDKSARQGKHKYAAVVRAAAEAMQKCVIDAGETGGWEE